MLVSRKERNCIFYIILTVIIFFSVILSIRIYQESIVPIDPYFLISPMIITDAYGEVHTIDINHEYTDYLFRKSNFIYNIWIIIYCSFFIIIVNYLIPEFKQQVQRRPDMGF